MRITSKTIKMINKLKNFTIPANFYRVFYIFLPVLVFLKLGLGEKSFVELMVILVLISLISEIILRLCCSKKEYGFASIFSPLTRKTLLTRTFEHLFWLFLTCLAVIYFAEIRICTICLTIYAFSKSFAYLLSKPFKSNKFFDITIAEAVSFFAIGFVVATFLASYYDFSFGALISIYSSLILMTLTDARKKLIKFNNPSLAILVFVISLTILNGIWSVF